MTIELNEQECAIITAALDLFSMDRSPFITIRHGLVGVSDDEIEAVSAKFAPEAEPSV